MRTSQAGLNVIKTFEGFRARSEKLPNGRWVIGYGHVRRAKEGVRVSESEAEAILREYDLPPVERFVMRCVLAPMTQNEFDALVSLAYNIGAKAFAQSDVVASMNSGNHLAAAEHFDAWKSAKIGGRVQIVDALVRRRAAEKALFLNAPGRMPIASSRLYRAMHVSEGLPQDVEAVPELLVEHRPEPDQGVTATSAVEDLPEPLPAHPAAETVRQQMVRILGEDGSKVSSPSSGTDGATPEEITAAISELAGLSQGPELQKSVWPSRDDRHEHNEVLEPLSGADVIDDLEEIEVTDESIARAMRENRAMMSSGRRDSMFSALPFGILALIGAMLSGYGIASQLGAVRADSLTQSAFQMYLPLFLVFLGTVLFMIMGYFFLKVLSPKA